MDTHYTEAMEALIMSESDEADIELKKISSWEQFAKKIELSVNKVSQINGKVDNIHNLTVHDLNCLFTFGFFEVWICLMSPRTDENFITFEDGTYYSKNQLEFLYKPEFVNDWIKFILSLKSYQLTDIELELFASAAYFSERPSLTDIKAVKKSQDYYIEILNEKITTRTATSSVKLPTFEISQMLAKLNALGRSHNLCLEWLKKKWSKVQFSEIVDLVLQIPRPLKMPERLKDSSSAEAIESQKIWLWNKFSITVASTVQLLINYMNTLPGFFVLIRNDKINLIKHGFFELWYIKMLSGLSESGIILGASFYSRQQLELLYDSDFVDDLIQISFGIHKTSEFERRSLFAAVLFTERPGLTDVEAVKKLRDDAIENFMVEKMKKCAITNDSPSTFDLFQTLEKMNAFNLRHSNFIDWLRKNLIKLNLAEFFCEIFDI